MLQQSQAAFAGQALRQKGFRQQVGLQGGNGTGWGGVGACQLGGQGGGVRQAQRGERLFGIDAGRAAQQRQPGQRVGPIIVAGVVAAGAPVAPFAVQLAFQQAAGLGDALVVQRRQRRQRRQVQVKRVGVLRLCQRRHKGVTGRGPALGVGIGVERLLIGSVALGIVQAQVGQGVRWCGGWAVQQVGGLAFAAQVGPPAARAARQQQHAQRHIAVWAEGVQRRAQQGVQLAGAVFGVIHHQAERLALAEQGLPVDQPIGGLGVGQPGHRPALFGQLLAGGQRQAGFAAAASAGVEAHLHRVGRGLRPGQQVL